MSKTFKPKVTSEVTDKGVVCFRYNLDKKIIGHILKVLNISDVHLDSKSCNKELLKKHCEQADYIKIYGDLFDLMQGKHDKRRSNSEMKDIYLKSNYIDQVVKDAVDFFKPYAKKLIFVSLGNHETSVIANAGTNPISAFCLLMRMEGSPVIEGTYQGFITDRFIQGNSMYSFITAYHHGYGGNAKKTEGALEMEEDKAKYPNADLVVKGHNHYRWHNPGQTRYWLTTRGKIEKKVQHHLRLGTYKEGNATEGWEVEKGFKPISTGGWFINYEMFIDDDGKSYAMKFKVEEA